MSTQMFIFRGLPASGKTTKAREMATGFNDAVVGRDHFRYGVFGRGVCNDLEENTVTNLQTEAINSTLRAGGRVFIDDMNLRASYVKRFIKLAEGAGVEWEIVDMTNVQLAVLLARNAERERKVPEDVIRRNYDRFVKGKSYPLPVNMPDNPEAARINPRIPYVCDNPALCPPAILVDIDGTLAHMHNRSPYDETKVYDDHVDEVVAGIVRKYAEDEFIHIILMSGRSEECRPETKRWLREKAKVDYDVLHMRRTVEDRGRKDSEVKLDLFDAHVRHNYNVLFVLDDRQQVVDAWRSIGLKCLQVQEGNF